MTDNTIAQACEIDSRFGVLGEGERVLVDGEPGAVVDSPTKDSYTIRLDSGETVHRMRTTIQISK